MRLYKNAVLSAAIVSALGMSSCAQTESTESSDTNALNAKVELLSPADFKTTIGALKDYQLIDVRTPGEVAGGAIEGSINIDFKADNFKAKMAELDKSKPTFVYCAGGYRSGKAADMMKEMGFEHIIDLDGGFGAWQE